MLKAHISQVRFILFYLLSIRKRTKMLDVALVFAFMLLFFWYVKSWTHPINFPPGPRKPLPFVGDSYILGRDLSRGFYRLQEKYGNICGLWLGPRRCVVVSDFKILQDILNKSATANRLTVKVAGIKTVLLHQYFRG